MRHKTSKDLQKKNGSLEIVSYASNSSERSGHVWSKNYEQCQVYSLSALWISQILISMKELTESKNFYI